MIKKLFVIAIGFSLLLSMMLAAGGDEAIDGEEVAVEENGAFFDVEIIEYPKEVRRGDEVEIKYSVNNTGEDTGTQDLVLSIKGEELDIEEVNRDENVTLSPGGEWNNTYIYDTSDVDVSTFFLEFSTELSLLLESNDDNHSGTITVTEPMLDIPGFTFILLIIGVISAVAIHKKRNGEV